MIDVVLKDSGRIIATIAEDKVFTLGSEIGPSFDPTQAHLFADEGVPATGSH